MNRERRMNMLSPAAGARVLNADVETGKVVNEWSFQKDGLDVEMKDLANDTRAAQLDDRDTFLGIGQNRRAPPCHHLPNGLNRASPTSDPSQSCSELSCHHQFSHCYYLRSWTLMGMGSLLYKSPHMGPELAWGSWCRLVRWDMRAKGGAVQDSPVVEYKEGKDYASKVDFNCMATSGGAPLRCNPISIRQMKECESI